MHIVIRMISILCSLIIFAAMMVGGRPILAIQGLALSLLLLLSLADADNLAVLDMLPSLIVWLK